MRSQSSSDTSAVTLLAQGGFAYHHPVLNLYSSTSASSRVLYHLLGYACQVSFWNSGILVSSRCLSTLLNIQLHVIGDSIWSKLTAEILVPIGFDVQP